MSESDDINARITALSGKMEELETKKAKPVHEVEVICVVCDTNGHAGFYRCFIALFSAISTPLCRLLASDVPFEWTIECQVFFEKLKKSLVSAPIIQSPDWSLPFELMCDVSDYAVGAG